MDILGLILPQLDILSQSNAIHVSQIRPSFPDNIYAYDPRTQDVVSFSERVLAITYSVFWHGMA